MFYLNFGMQYEDDNHFLMLPSVLYASYPIRMRTDNNDFLRCSVDCLHGTIDDNLILP